MKIDDSILQKKIFSSVCSRCKHLNVQKLASGETKPTCTAFPKQIPEEIWLGSNDHTNPYPGDRGIQFELRQIPKRP